MHQVTKSIGFNMTSSTAGWTLEYPCVPLAMQSPFKPEINCAIPKKWKTKDSLSCSVSVFISSEIVVLWKDIYESQ